jgi:clan AA aspartic protease (TIGR02281 family)
MRNFHYLIVFYFSSISWCYFAQINVAPTKIINGKTYYLHEVKATETLFSIKTLYGVSIEEIKMLNPDKVNNVKLTVGEILLIPKKTVVIPMKKMSGGTYEISCKVNGLALNFIFDTGASDVSISLTEALFMFKNGYLEESDILGTQYYSIANGDIAEGTLILIKKLEFGGQVLVNVEASIVHEMQAPLLLGQSAISKLGKIQIDPDKGTLTIIDN